MTRIVPLLSSLLAVLVPAVAHAQEGSTVPAEAVDGPVIHGFGAVYDIPAVELETPVDVEYRVVFDVSRSGEPGTVNPYLNTAARFLNMHARAGVPPGGMRVAVVLHGEAAKDALTAAPFRERYGTDNPNVELIRRLAEAGVEVYMCGQSVMARELPRDGLAESVRMALSAMTARAVLHERGFRSLN